VLASLTGSGMKFGIVGYYYSKQSTNRKTAKEIVESYVEDVEEKFKEFEDNSRIKISSSCGKTHGDDDDAWIAGCLLIEQKSQTV